MTWRALPHRDIQQLDDDLWVVEGDLPRGPMPRTMTLVRLADRRVVVHSAIALDADAMRAIEAWGIISVVIVPNDRHRLDAAAYRERYPDVKVICPAGARAKVEEKVSVDATSVELGADIRYAMVPGTNDGEGYLVVGHGSQTTLVLGDIVMNLRPMRGLGGWIMNRMGFTGDVPKVVPATKKVLVADLAAARAGLETLAATPKLGRVIVAHGAPIADDPAGMLRVAAAAL